VSHLSFQPGKSPVEVEVDYVVVGSGAGGATAAVTLARGGAQVAVVEAGPWRDPEDYPRSVCGAHPGGHLRAMGAGARGGRPGDGGPRRPDPGRHRAGAVRGGGASGLPGALQPAGAPGRRRARLREPLHAPLHQGLPGPRPVPPGLPGGPQAEPQPELHPRGALPRGRGALLRAGGEDPAVGAARGRGIRPLPPPADPGEGGALRGAGKEGGGGGRPRRSGKTPASSWRPSACLWTCCRGGCPARGRR
jgi:hypothetical protein